MCAVSTNDIVNRPGLIFTCTSASKMSDSNDTASRIIATEVSVRLFLNAGRLLTTIACALTMLAAARETVRAQATPLTITLTGQSMLRSDLRATAPKAVPVIQGL